MDIRLPDANGIELTAQIMQMLPATKVIIVSQYSELAYVERALAAGAYAYIGKDQLYRMLLATIKRALGRGAAAAPITGIHEPRATRHD